MRLSPGFTLMEVLVALAVLAVALTALLKATGENQSALIQSWEMTRMALLAESKINDLESRPDELQFATSGNFESDDEEEDDNQDYTWEFELQSIDIEGVRKGVLLITSPADISMKVERIFLEPKE